MVIRKLIHNCVLCRRLEGEAYATAPMLPLPTYRVSEKQPFYYTGVDLAGPIFLKKVHMKCHRRLGYAYIQLFY